ncbi:hypothetical protein KBC99_00605 [Candidatus Saccharibacteria bacterium]|nr:hypothetical protein [Candidatus Saccharibacteria bacterium]
MTWFDFALFFITFIICYVIGSVIVKIIHFFTKDTSKNYRIGIIIFSLLMAGMLTYNNLGRNPSDYANPLDLFGAQYQELR